MRTLRRSRFRRGRRSFRTSKRELIWVTTYGSQQVLADGSFSAVTLADASSWARNAGSGILEKGCTVLRVVGDVCCTLDADASPPATEEQQAVCGVWAGEGGAAPTGLSTGGLDEMWMHLEQFQLRQVLSSVATLTWEDGANALVQRRWDIKVKRKLTSLDVLRFFLASTPGAGGSAGSAVNAYFTLRVLLQLP